MRLNMAEWILTSSILILMVLLIRLAFRKRLTAKIRYGIWLLVLLRLLLPFLLFDSSLSLLRLIPYQESETETESTGTFWNQQTGEGISPSPSQAAPALPQMAVPGIGGQMPDLSQNNNLSRTDTLIRENLIFILWTMGMVVTVLVIVGSNLHFWGKVRKSRKRLETLQEDRSLPVYLSDAVPMPCMFGLLRPAVYVRNQDVDDQEAMSYILRHEYMHYRHKDHVWAIFRGLCLVLHWYNPLVWVAAYCSKQDAELACDESVIRYFSAEEAERYGKVLLSLTLQNSDYWTMLSCATTFGGGKSYLKERISRIAQRPRLFLFSTGAVMVLCVIALLFTFTGNSEELAEEGDFAAGPEIQVSPQPQVGLEPKASPEAQAGLESQESPEPQASPGAQGGTEPSRESTDMDSVVVEEDIFVNDFLVDMNGDGIRDIIRLRSRGDNSLDTSMEKNEALRKAVEGNYFGWYEIAIYDGASAADMQTFQKGDEVNQEARVDVFDNLAQPHAGNGQYSYYEEDGKGFLIYNSPYMGQGVGGYYYEVFTYSNTWEKEVVAANFLGFSVNIYPYDPYDIMELWKEPETYLAEEFPVEEMVDYTMELKGYLDRATIIMDTSIWGKVFFTTCYEDNNLRPDAFAIWHWGWDWDEVFLSLDSVDSEESLREALFDVREAILQEIEALLQESPHPYAPG